MLNNIELPKKIAVIQMVYQLITSSKYGAMPTSRDDQIIDYCNSVLGNKTDVTWNVGIQFDPHISFDIVSEFTDSEKIDFVLLIYKCVDIASNIGYNDMIWLDIASQIMQKTKCTHLL